MSTTNGIDTKRKNPLSLSEEKFKSIGYKLVDEIADFLSTIDKRPVAKESKPSELRRLLAPETLPSTSQDPEKLLSEASSLLFNNSTFNGHPKFWGYITSSPAPIGILSEMLAATINPNVGGWNLSPMATEIEKQTIRWIAELIHYPADCGGILVSGGNMANFVAFLAARQKKATWDLRKTGLSDSSAKQMIVYGSGETHTWIQKAADLFGMGTNNIRWIETDSRQRMKSSALMDQIENDLKAGFLPFMVVGTAGTVSTGAVDPLPELGKICKKYDLWFHVDGAYGAFAASLPEASSDMKGLQLADSIAMDPHKWLYSPLEAGCTLVRNPDDLPQAFSYLPDYYHFGNDEKDPKVNFYEYGFQNSRGFRALKVWLGLKHAGSDGVKQMIRDDIQLGSVMAAALRSHGEFEVFTEDLSITTFRYRPSDKHQDEETLDKLNSDLLTILQNGGDAFISNAVIDGKFLLRACIVNFRTTKSDVEALPLIIAKIGETLI